MTKKRITDRDCFSNLDTDALKGTQMYGAELREFIEGKIEVIPKTMEHIKVNDQRCNGCGLCEIVCPGGCYEMVDHKARWAFPNNCLECGVCLHVCSEVNAIDWTYPEAGTGVVLKWS